MDCDLFLDLNNDTTYREKFTSTRQRPVTSASSGHREGGRPFPRVLSHKQLYERNRRTRGSGKAQAAAIAEDVARVSAPRLPDADRRPVLAPTVRLEISRFPCKERAHMPGSPTPPGCRGACDDARRHVAFRRLKSVGTRNKDHFDARVLHWVKCRRHKLDDHRWPVDIEFLQMLDGTYDGDLDIKQYYHEKLKQSIFENRNYNITITENDLFMNYPFLQKYNSRQLCDLIESTSSFRFAPASFDIKYLKQKATLQQNSSTLKNWDYSYGFYRFSPIEQRVKTF